jgi:LacI family transcriptional regulator
VAANVDSVQGVRRKDGTTVNPGDAKDRAHPGVKPLKGIREVAHLAGVSQGTVSNVLNHPERVSVKTRKHVEAVIERLGFVPNRGAADLRRGHSHTIGLVLPDITNPFFAEVARGAIAAAAARGYVAVLCDSDLDAGKEAINLNLLEEQRVAGVLLIPVGQVPERLARLRARDIGVVLVDRAATSADFCSVSVNDIGGGEIATAHLLEGGPTKQITLVNGSASIRQCSDRRHGCRRAIRLAGLPADALIEIVVPAMTVLEGAKAGRVMIDSGRLPDAVFCANDLLAIGVLRAFAAAGVSVPDQVRIVGYDNLDRGHDLPIPLTSIRQPSYQLGHRGSELVIAEIEDSAHQHERLVFGPAVVPRATSAGPRRRHTWT